MSRPHRHDPFDTLVELTTAAMTCRPPRDFVYAPAGPSMLDRAAALLQRVRLPRLERRLVAANDPDSGEGRLLQRYY